MTQEDGRRRHRPKASTIHGWLCKWRGTFMGNEKVRQQGRREMKEAAALRTYRRQHGSSGKSSGGGGLFGFGRAKSRSGPTRHASRHTPTRGHSQRQGQTTHRPSQSRRPSHRHGDSRQSIPRLSEQGKGGAGVSRRGTSGSQAQKARAQVNRQVAVRRPSGRR